jgi:hypothetical protein
MMASKTPSALAQAFEYNQEILGRKEDPDMSVDRNKLLRLAKEAAESEQQSQAILERVFAEAREDRDREDEAWRPDPAVIHRLAEEAAANGTLLSEDYLV